MIGQFVDTMILASTGEGFKQLVEQHYKEPVNGQFEDCTKEVLPGVETESGSDEEDQNITTE